MNLPKTLLNPKKKFQEARKSFLEMQFNRYDIVNFEVIRDDKYALICTCNIIDPVHTHNNDKPVLIAWAGTKSKTNYFTRFQTKDRLEKAIDRLESNIKYKEDVKEAKKEGHENVKIGDIFSSSWGYEQTNVNFYEVVGKKGKSTLIMREIAQERTYESSGLTGQCKPIQGRYINKEVHEKRYDAASKKVRISSYRSAYMIKMKEVAGVLVLPSFYWSAYH